MIELGRHISTLLPQMRGRPLEDLFFLDGSKRKAAGGLKPRPSASGNFASRHQIGNVTCMQLAHGTDGAPLEVTVQAVPKTASPSHAYLIVRVVEPSTAVPGMAMRLLTSLPATLAAAGESIGGDKTWADLTALMVHFETQPLPTPLSWWAHQLPKMVHQFNCAMMYVIELGLPFAIFVGRWGRLAACLGFSTLMVLVALTGNYTFFNLLTIFLALTLLDDGWWPAVVKRCLRVPEVPVVRWKLRYAGAHIMALVLVIFSLVAADQFLVGRIPGYKLVSPEALTKFYGQKLGPWRSISGYGLFQSMTTERMELVVEVSDDRILWSEVPFKWKPGDVKMAPRFVAPYQPRLDWQMWFAALHPGFVPQRDADPRYGMAWFGPFLGALLEQRPAVWDLLGEPPFPIKDIRAIRVVQYRYHFTTPAERQATGAWWKREQVGMFSPEFVRRRADS